MPEQSKWEGRSRASAWGYRFFVWLLRNFGIGPAYRLVSIVTVYYRFFIPSATRPLKYLYTQRLGFSTKKANQLIRRNLVVFGQTLVDKVAVLAGVNQRLQFTHEGIHHLEEMVAAGQGGMLISAHIGNWEVAGQLLNRLDATINILMYDGEDKAIKEYMERFESNRSFNLILIRDDMSHIYDISAALRRNELICLHADRFRPGNRTVSHEFLGKKALFPAGPFILASKLKAPVSFVFAIKENERHYHFFAEPAKLYSGRGTTGADNMLSEYVQLLEEKLKQYPEQWFNYFDFWDNGTA